MKTLFWDFDGVLHPEPCHESRHFCCLPVFEQVLRSVLWLAGKWRALIVAEDEVAKGVHTAEGMTCRCVANVL